ncbi:MAG: beta-galactosidase, partial [Gemmatimonadaceae bacterium]
MDGVSLALEWRHIEPAEGRYDFSIIDATLAALEPYEKKLVLAPFSFRVPDYLITDPRVQTYLVPHIGPGFITPVPWDVRGLQRFEALYAAVSDHKVPDRSKGGSLVPLRDHALLVGVSSWVMGMNGIRDIAQLSGQSSPLYAQPGYSRDALTSG